MSWYYAQGDDTVGPVSEDEFNQLRSIGVVREQTMVWRDGWTDWLPLAQTPDYAPLQTPAVATAQLDASKAEVHGAEAMEVPANADEIGEDIPPELAEATERFVSGARWYYWIAGLSLVNSLIAAFQGDIYFVVGLAISIIVDQIGWVLSEELGQAAMFIALGVNVLISGVVAAFGYFSLKGIRWVMMTGIVLYICDGLICLLFQDWLSAGFHAYAGFCLIRGFGALNTLKKAGVNVG
ncbi:MAG: DUF4339 domain-containing protein [Puniceicoccales bacterium]